MAVRTHDEDELREMALARLERKQEFYADLLAYVLVNGMLVAIWAMSGGGFFWPIFPIFGLGHRDRVPRMGHVPYTRAYRGAGPA